MSTDLSNIIFTFFLQFLLKFQPSFRGKGISSICPCPGIGLTKPWQELPFLPAKEAAMDNLYADIAARTGGNIYIGVVGPVRTGKSTFIKRFMEQLVIPAIDDPYRKDRARDELPQSGSGKTIMTSEPKFVPEEAVEISPDGTSQLRVRLIDSVGYMVSGAVGAEEDGVPRMVATPWYDHEIPMTEAAELGTKKVMSEHCSIGLVITTDGTITDIPRSDYADAERRAIADMKQTGKPFLTIINSREPGSEASIALKEKLMQEHGINVVVADCQSLDKEDICGLLRQLLYAFPMAQMQVYMPRWVDALPSDDPVRAALYQKLLQCAESISTLAQAGKSLEALDELDSIADHTIRSIDLATGTVNLALTFPEKLFYEVLSSRAGLQIQDDGELIKLLTELTAIQKEYDRVADALSAVKATGYGVVMPSPEDMALEKPEIVQKGSTYGVKLKAGAPSIHMIRVDVDTEIAPMVGNEQQSRDLIEYLTGESPEKLWESNIFGKSVYTMIREGLTGKLLRTPDDVRDRFRGTLSRIVNEGATGLVCLIL